MALNRLKACGGLQPVPEESAANGTTAAANPDATVAASAPPVNLLEHCVKNADGTDPSNAGVTAGRNLRRWCSEDAAAERPPPDNVPENEYRIWFPRAEVSHEDSTDRASSDWRTFREYRYTECSRAGRLEKTLSVDEVHKRKDSPGTLAAAIRQPTLAFHCVSCSNEDEHKGGSLGEERKGRCRMLSSTKSELFREHRGQQLSRLIDEDPTSLERSPQPLETRKSKLSQDPETDETGKVEARTSSVCQTNTEKVAFEGDDLAKKCSSNVPSSYAGGMASTPASRSPSDGDFKNVGYLAVSAGVQDASLASVDDEFDDSKCTYVKVDSVDSEVEDENGLDDGKAVIGAPSPDELGLIAEEPEDELEETSKISEVRSSLSTMTHDASKTESNSVLSSARECRPQESLSSKSDIKDSSNAEEKGNGLRFSGNIVDAAARLTASLNAPVDGQSLECHSEDSKDCVLDNESAGQSSHKQDEQKDSTDAALRLDDLSDAETNESETKSVESVIFVKDGTVTLPNTNGQSAKEAILDTIVRSANGKENSLETVEMFGTSDRPKQELILNETVETTKSSDVVKSEEKHSENAEDISFCLSVNELIKTPKHASVLDSESTSSNGVFDHGTCGTDSKNEQFSLHAEDLQESKHAHKDLTESLKGIALKNEHVFSEAGLSHQEELRNFEDSPELMKDSAVHTPNVSDSIEQVLKDASKANVSSVTSKYTFNNEEKASVQVGKEHASTVNECGWNEPDLIASEQLERSSIDFPELRALKLSQLLQAGTLTEESTFESVTRLTSVGQVSEKTQESVTSITDDSLLSRNVARTKKASAGEDGAQRENSDVPGGLKNGVEKILKIGDALKQDSCQITELRFLKNTEVEAQKILKCFTNDEEPWKRTSKTVSSILNDSTLRKSVLDDDVVRVTHDVEKRDEHLRERGLKEFRADVVERFDKLALEDGPGFQAEGASVFYHFQTPNASVNKIQDYGVNVEKTGVTGNEENVPTILADEHHLFKEPQISSVEGQEGTGVMSTVTGSVHEESSLSSSIKVSMLKDVIALNRTDDATSVDDASLQDDNDQGFESLPCDQTLDSQDLNEEQVRHESGNVKDRMPLASCLDNDSVENDSNISADKLTVLLEEHVGPEKATPISSQHETTAQTLSTEATDQKNETSPEPDLRSRISTDDVDSEGKSVESCVNRIASDEKLRLLSATSSEIEKHEETKLQASQETSGEDYSAVTAKHSITEITVYNGDSKGTHVKGIQENATKTSDPHEIEKSTSQENMQEKEQEAGTQNETSEELASEHSGNQSSGDDSTTQLSKDISVNCSQNIGTPTESIEGDGIFEELLTKKHVNCNSSNEVIEAKEQHFVKESTIISKQYESILLHETLEGHLGEESVNESTSHSAIAKLEADPSKTTLPNIAGHNKESALKEISEESSGGRTTNSSSSVVDVSEPKELVEELAEHVDSGASVPREVSEGSEGGPPLSRSTGIEITVIKSDIPVRKISDTIVPNDVSMQSELTEVRSDEDPPCRSTGNKDVTMVGDEASTNLRSNDLKTQSKNPDDIASERPVTHLTSDQHATNVMPDLSASEFPEMAVSNELRVQSETVDVLGNEEHSNQSKSNVDVTDGAAEISGGEVPEIVGITEVSEIREMSGEPVSEVAVNDKTNGQITKKEPLKAVCELPETLFNSESSAQSKAPGILANEEFGNHDNTTLEVTKVGEEVSVGEVVVTVASTESIWEKETSGVSGSKEFVEQNTYENITEVKQDPSTWELADGTHSSEMSAQSKASDVLSCKQPEKHQKADIDEPKLNVGVSASDVPNIAACAEPAERKEKPEQPASKAPEDENLNDITRSQQDAPAFEWPARAFSRKLSLQFRTPDSLASEKPFCGDSDKHNAKTFVSELPKILVTFDPDDNTIGEFLNEKTSWPGASDTGVTTNASFGELSGTVMSTETSAPCETPEVSASESHANQNITKAELNMFEPGASVSGPPETAALNEASVQSTASGESSREKTRDHINDNWNATTERDISVRVLSEIVTTSNEAVTTCESPEESASDEATPQDITDDASEVKEEIEASEVSEVRMTDDTSLGQGTTPGNEECEEITKESSGDNGVIKAKVETSNELPDITVLDEECVKDNPSEDSTSGKPVNNTTSNKQIDNLDAKTSESESANVALGIEVTIQSETTKNLTGGEVVRQSVHDDNGKVEKQMSSNVLRNFTEPDKYSVQTETSNNLATFMTENEDPNGVATTEAKSETADMGSSDILPPNEDSSLDVAAKKSASEENLPKTKRDVEITTIKENMPISRVPEISMPSEPIFLSKSPPELTSHVGANESIIIQEITHVNAGKSAKETPEVATPNEASVKIGVTEQLTSKENSDRMSIDNEHIKTKLKTSASFLPEISESDNKKVQTPDELPSEKTATGVATETSAQRLLERDETMKGPTSDDPNESHSEVVEACLEIETQKDKNEGIVADGVAAREQVEPVTECTRVKSDIAKRFANADSCDELDEDNETASTGTESVQSDTVELVRSDDAVHSDSIEEIDKAFKDITGGSLEDTTNEYVQTNDSWDVHVLNEKRDSNREETMGTDAHVTSAEQLSLDDFAEDTKKPSRKTSTSGGCVQETVAEKFREATEGHHTTELAKWSSGGDAFEPIVPRQSVFEKVVPLADLDTNWDPNQATPIISVLAEKAEGPDELLSSTPMSEVENEAVSAAPVDETATICKMTENAEIGVPLNSSEDVGLSQVTEEEHDGDASDHTVSVSKALAADAGSSENQSSTYGRNRNLFPDQVAGQSDQSERMRREEAKPVAAGIVDAASCERPKEVSETWLDSVESLNKDESEEPEHRIVMMEPLKNQESQLNEYLFTESATRVIEKSSGHSPSENKARSGDQGEETEEAEHETAANSFSESSLTTVSVKTEDPAERLSEYSTRASEQESDTVPADEVNKDNSGASNICEADPENVLNNQFNETRSLSTQHTVTGSNNNTEEGHQEATSQSETFQEPAGQSVIPRNAEGGHEECDISEEAKKTIVPDSLDMSSQDVYTQVASNDEENKTSELCVDTNDYGSVRQNERYIFKHESATAVDNDMESFGALSTVYESSLEYVRSNTDEHISDSEFSKTVSGDYDTVCEATNSKTVSFKHSTKIGDMFEIGKHSDEQKSQQNFKESVHFLSNAGGKNESVRDIAKAINDPAVAPAFVHEKPADPIGKHVDSNYLIANEIQIDTQKKKETNVSEASHGWANTREASKKNAAVIKDMDVPLRSREVGEKQNILQSNSSQYVTKDTSDEKAPRGLRTRSLDEEYTERQEKERHGLKARSLDENIKQYATAIRDDSTDSVISEVHKTNIANSHESLQKNRMAPEQDEVATMDFSDEDDRFPEDMRAHEVVVSVDVHEVPVFHNWDDIESAEAAKEDACGKTFLSSRSVVTTTEVANREDKNGTEETNPSQQNVEVQGQKAEVGANNPSAMATPDQVKNSNAESLSGELQRTIGAIKTAVMVHDETNLEALECSEDLLQSVATEADFPSDIYENADDDTDGGIGDTNGEQPATGLRAVSDDVLITHKDLRVSPEKHDCLNQVDASKEVKQRGEDTEEQRKSSSTDTVEGMKVPDYIRSPSNKSSTESESVSQEQHIVSNGGLKYAVEDFIRLISSDGDDIQTSKKKGDEKSRIHDAADDNVDAEAGEAQGGEKNGEHKAADDKEGRKADKDDQEDSLKTDSSESFDLSAAGAGDIDSGSRKVKENTTHNVTEAVEQSERTEGGATGDRVRSTRIFQKTIKRTESTRTVRKTRSFLPYTKWIRGETRQRDRQETRDEDDAMEPVEEALVVPYQSFPAMSIPRMGLCPMPESSPGNVCSVAVQAFPSVVDQGVQVEFDEPDCITRLVELQIAMNEQEEVRRQDMKAACELVEKLEAMQLSESLMRTQLRAMDAERREQSAREARLRDELTAWQETVQQQQLLLQQLKEDLDDTEDTLAAQRQEANRLREQMLVLQESCDSSLLMVDVLGRADKEVQTPDGGQQSLSSSSPYKGIRLENSSPMYLDQLSQHRRLSALVSSQLEATANRIAQLRREAAVNRPRGSTIDDYVQDLAVRTPDDLIRGPEASPSESASGT
ncbi:hypothetical protein MRX96_026035 [Rhipicephalus microplus]